MTGSGAAVQAMLKRKPDFLHSTLAYYDAAIAAKRILIPMHCACAMFDPMVAPPGQFAVYNAIPSEKDSSSSVQATKNIRSRTLKWTDCRANLTSFSRHFRTLALSLAEA